MMNLQSLLQDFNPGTFVVYSSLLLFLPLLCLRLDGVLQVSYWVIFSPLWVWKVMLLTSATVGVCSWWKRPAGRPDLESDVHFKAMLLSLTLHLLLLLFELLVCDKLQSGRHIWVLVFLPLLLLSATCVAACIWSLKHERRCEMELFAAVNLLQLIFTALRLDSYITWRWEIVFIPLWFTFSLATVGVLYSFLLAAVFMRSAGISTQQRQATAHAAFVYALLVLPGLISQIMLTKKLDGDMDLPYSMISIPLLMSVITVLLRSFSARGGNLWWCGMQKDFYLFLLDIVPSLREYGNISYHGSLGSSAGVDQTDGHQARMKPRLRTDLRPVAPVIAIDVPD